MKNYIGLGTSPHDPSLAIINKNGELVYAEASERPLQSKRAWGSVPDHINYIQKLVDEYCDSDIDTVVASTWSEGKVEAYKKGLPELDEKIAQANSKNRHVLLKQKFIRRTHSAVLDISSTGLEIVFNNKNSNIEKRGFDHHLTHAAAAAFASSFEKALCVVIDGFGEKSPIAAFEFNDGGFTQLDSVSAEISASLGYFYSFMCETCGFNAMQGEEWKVMGLAAYGKYDQKLYDIISPLLSVKGVTLSQGENIADSLNALIKMRRKPDVSAIEYADFAATAQFVYTETVIELLNNLHGLNISENLILSGGCALNSSTNGKIIENTAFKELFINSAPADDGNAIGAAYLAYYQDHAYQPNAGEVQTPYLGSEIKNSALAKLTEYCSMVPHTLDDENLFKVVAKALADGKIVGWVQGKAEFGPRALGNRSILADPRFKEVKDRINATVKFREEFRPFAPSILHECGESYFENYQYTPYMERTLTFKESVQEKVLGVVHEDGTGRLQSVTKNLNLRYYNLIKAFYDLTDVPVLLNTSFNVMGKPIVHSVEDAVAVFQTSGLDLLVINNVVFFKDNNYQLSY